MAFKTTRNIDWGDCDAAGIVFYPNYFRWMDSVFHEMTTTLGFDQSTMPKHGLFATPLLDARATFRSPARFGTTLDAAVRVDRLGGSSFGLAYHFVHQGRTIAEGREDRICVRRDEADEIAKVPMPDTIRSLLERYHE